MIETATRFYFDMPTQKVDTGTARLTCRRYGSGSPLLLVHGFPLSGFTWRKVLPELSKPPHLLRTGPSRHGRVGVDGQNRLQLPGAGTDAEDAGGPAGSGALRRVGAGHRWHLRALSSAGRRRTSREAGTDQHGGATPSSAVDPPLPTAAVPARGDGVLPSAAAFQAVSALWHGFRRLLHRPRPARRRFSPARDPAPAAFDAQDGRDGPLPARLEVGAGGRSRAGACTHHDAGATDLGRRRSHLPRRVRAQDGEAATRRAAGGNSGRSPVGARGEAGGSRARGAGLPWLKPRGSGLAASVSEAIGHRLSRRAMRPRSVLRSRVPVARARASSGGRLDRSA